MLLTSVLTGLVSTLTFGSVVAGTKLSTRMSTLFTIQSYILTILAAAQDYFDTTMALGDSRFDANYGYVWYLDNGPWSIRFTAWYLNGLLYRNKGSDLANAEKALRKM